VWLAEQKAAQEKKRIEQWKREKMEELKIAELRALQDAASGRVRQDRVDWIYEAPVAKTTSNEEYLLGKKIDSFDEVNVEGGTDAPKEKKEPEATEEKPGSLWFGDELDPTVDTASKIRDDPLFAIKQRERDALKHILDNPMQMKKLKDEVKNKKLAKKLKKEGKHHSSSNNSNKDDYDRRSRKRERSRSRSPSRKSRRHSRSPSPRRSSKSHRSSSSRHRDSEKQSSSSSHGYSDNYKFVNQNYEHYKKLADERSKLSWKREKRKPLSEEEKKRRLKEMESDAVAHERARDERLKRDRATEQREKAEMLARSKGDDMSNAKFINDLNKQVFEEVNSVADRIGRGRAQIDRSVINE